jgi:hypothetical protein
MSENLFSFIEPALKLKNSAYLPNDALMDFIVVSK